MSTPDPERATAWAEAKANLATREAESTADPTNVARATREAEDVATAKATHPELVPYAAALCEFQHKLAELGKSSDGTWGAYTANTKAARVFLAAIEPPASEEEGYREFLILMDETIGLAAEKPADEPFDGRTLWQELNERPAIQTIEAVRPPEGPVDLILQAECEPPS